MKSISQLVDGILGSPVGGKSLAGIIGLPQAAPPQATTPQGQFPAGTNDLGNLGMIGAGMQPNGQAVPINTAAAPPAAQPAAQPAQRGALNPWGIAAQVIGGQGQTRLPVGVQPTSFGNGISNITHGILGIKPAADNQVSDNAEDAGYTENR